MDYPDIDFEKLKKEQDDYNNQKSAMDLVGTIGQNVANVPTFYEAVSGKNLGSNNVKGVTDAVSKGMTDPNQRQKQLYENWVQAKEVQKQKLADDETAKMTDPNSQVSKAYKAYALSKGWITPQESESMSAKDIMTFGDPKKMREIEAQSQINFANEMAKQKSAQTFQAGENAKNRAHDDEKTRLKAELEAGKKTDPRNLSGTDKARFDNALMVARAVDEMGKALDNGDNTFSMIGDNNYTESERKAAEAYGRMQSGGAINKEEEQRFLAMLPRSSDSKEMQRKKLISQRDEMISRLKTLGFTPQQAGYTPQEFNYGSSDVNTANAKNQKPKTVIQNGHTYTLNPTTGEYE